MKMRTFAALAMCLAALLPTTPATAGASGFPMPAPSMAGVNNWHCVPTARHPRPVVLVHGTSSDQGQWDVLAPLLIRRGYCVFALDYGAHWFTLGRVNGFGPVKDSANQVAAFIDRVRAATRSRKVDFVGTSQGGLIGEYWAKFLGGAGKTRRMVLLAPATHGTTFNGLTELDDATIVGRPVTDVPLGLFCPACVDMEKGSVLINKLAAGPIAQKGIAYTVAVTKNDTTVTPPASQFIKESGVKNFFVQDLCPGVKVEHKDMGRTAITAQIVLNALDPTAAHPVRC